jgi:hypothetical protein
MTRYSQLYAEIADLYRNTKSPELIQSVPNFPFPKMYPGQKQILDLIEPDSSFCLTSHTGFGKTAVFLTLTRDIPSIVIEPRKFLQEQVGKYFGDFVLYGRSGYHCKYSQYGTAASAPCLLKKPCGETTFHNTCEKATATCLGSECKVFEADGYKIYPCSDCDYLAATKDAVSSLRNSGTVICNFGNFWNLLRFADTVVVDEADLFFREISAPIILKYTKPSENIAEIRDLLRREVSGLQAASKSSDAAFRYKAENALYNAKFLLANSDLCFTYQRKDKIYIEIDPRNTNILAQKLFKGKRVIIVSATPGQFDYPAYSASIHQRCGIYFCPVGNLTSRSLQQNPHILNTAAKSIEEISEYMGMVYDADRIIVHCGNIGTHATGLYRILGSDQCTLHQSGKLQETIDTFLKSDKKYLLVAAAEYGMDATWCKCQFILKFPYPNLDERMNTLKRSMGTAFSGWYAGEARTRVVQMAGRNVRGWDDFGVTICLDSKIQEDYARNTGKYPEWFRERICEKVF